MKSAELRRQADGSTSADPVEFEKPWKDSEQKFNLEQSRLRSRTRITHGRHTLFDFVLQAFNVYHGDELRLNVPGFFAGLRTPHLYVDSCSTSELHALEAALDVHLALDSDQEYWQSFKDLCQWRLKPPYELDSDAAAQLEALLEAKSVEELCTLVSSVDHLLQSPNPNKDYWEHALARTKAQLAKLRLEQFAQAALAKRQLNLEEASRSTVKVQPEDSPRLTAEEPAEGFLTPEEDEAHRAARRQEALNRQRQKYAEAQSALVTKSNPLLVNKSRLYNVMSSEKVTGESIEACADDLIALELAKKADGEVAFERIVELPKLVEEWHLKYKPRKPKYINRVKTGCEWTKHNQTHYDHSNPPPKVVQGYKFNIFYPNLVDKTKAPQFYLEPTDNNKTCIIRFHAGPPYEDIAFEIVNREWNFSDRHGFKCIFEKGILHLYFNFKRHRYKK